MSFWCVALFAAIVLSPIAILLLYFRFVRHKLFVSRHRLHLLHGGTPVILAHLSDFHYHPNSNSVLDEAVSKIVRHRPDVLFLTGDFVDREPDPVIPLLARLEPAIKACRHGAYACLGNHDSYGGKDSREIITGALERAGIVVLRNATHTIPALSLHIVGFEDMWTKEFLKHADVASTPASGMTTICLSHNPDSAPAIHGQHPSIHLQLSGHTHGGQVCLPIPSVFGLPHPVPVLGLLRVFLDQVNRLFPSIEYRARLWRRYSHVIKNWKWAHGLHQVKNNPTTTNNNTDSSNKIKSNKKSKKNNNKNTKNNNSSSNDNIDEDADAGMWLFVTRGIGTHLNMRLFCPPELAIIEIIRR